MDLKDEIFPIVADRKLPIKGRLADKLAVILTLTALGLSLLLSGLFFAGFVANDYHIFAITSALTLTVLLGGFAIVPLIIISVLAAKSYRQGGTKKVYLWALFLILPWLGLSILCLIYTPLPIWMSVAAALIASLLTLWASVSLLLELKNK